ncbi:Phosphatidylinositol 3-phosphate phosphatase [Trichophyton interdigitale]|uniref:Phosphatidylinositol 3-phosphate phosphatase n=1 Tax=Trichophyton interdigitale TaxID=101480 RepID=A0A9P5CZ37_9EURO|nr:Phosphatidylinositol 3-phosphate phosphatase [Trichophyton interdigitale]KAG5205982.1 Phosphatidylinositol 3-phosphate phosphatase [Trichophyton interdigitale]KAG8210359.1 Phosphatidylinositol 3-phosphate phosphatase [Trichophyton interdigitale]
MDKTRIAKVDEVTLFRRGEKAIGSLHLTPHHIVFSYIPPQKESSREHSKDKLAVSHKEIWITYPIICFCTYRPASLASRQPSSIRLRCRDFSFMCFTFPNEARSRDVYETIRAWTCKLGSIEKLYAFTFQPPAAELALNGWELYNPRKEWARLGVGRADQDSNWRISCINTDYKFSPTYPALLPVPSNISDNTINYAGRYRSRARIPVLTYLHPVNSCSITRSSQPLVGVRNNRSIQDEKLLAAIFSTSRQDRPLANASPPSLETESSNSSAEEQFGINSDFEFSNAEELEDEVVASARNDIKDYKTQIYGAQQNNLIVDARPTVNALAMQAVGLGSENMDNYKFAAKAYLGIDNIHVMRDSLNKVIEALRDSDISPLPPNRDQLLKSGWLKYIAVILDGAALIARQVGLQHSHVLIHCSDGWDRTGQLSALSQLCLDPYYRTLEGFMVLVEKDWLAFGHMFRHRSGHLNSDKWFQVENDRGSDSARGAFEGGVAGKALENALLSAKGFFNRDNVSRESLVEGDSDRADPDSSNSKRATSNPKSAVSDGDMTKPKETSPVFHQFLDATYQLLYQHPTRFEFNERFLRRLLYHLYSGQYGTFLYNSEKERVDRGAKEKTRSVWDYFLARRSQFINPEYDPLIDDNKRGSERLLFPRTYEVRWWAESFGRNDSEMNNPRIANSGVLVERDCPSGSMTPMVAVETADRSVTPVTVSQQLAASQPSTTGPTTCITSLAADISGLSLPVGKGDSPGTIKAREMEAVEMT